jgi:hypothetical protein
MLAWYSVSDHSQRRPRMTRHVESTGNLKGAYMQKALHW